VLTFWISWYWIAESSRKLAKLAHCWFFQQWPPSHEILRAAGASRTERTSRGITDAVAQ